MQAKLVGRGEELAVLKETFRRVQGEGRVALVTVVGPAGVGKTRLVRELEGYVDELPEFVYWRRGRCLAYGSSSYSALADAVKAQCEILEDDASDVALKKVENAVRELFGDTDVAPQIAALVGAGEPGSFNREDLFEAWRRFLERMAARYPLALVLEDIQWANNGLLDFVEYMADWAQGPILLAALARPELLDSRSTWGGGKRNATTIYLEPLSPEESATMVDDLLAGGLTPALTDTIATRSEGNPLYVEEIVRKLIDDGNLRGGEGSPWKLAKPIDDVELPRSIQSLIAARLDALPDDEKSLLQDASVVGRVFWSGAVASVSGLPVAEIHDALGRLRVKELIQPNEPPSFSGEQEFTFRHALLRDGAYDSLPKSLRARKHRQVAAWAQERAGDRAEEIAELIATHLLEALRYLNELGDVSDERRVIQREAYRWARAAGSRSSALWLAADAIDWYGEALRLAEMSRVSVSERAQLAVELLDVSWGVGPSDAFERACRAAIELCEAAADERGAGAAESSLMTVLFLQGRDEEALDAGARSLERLEKIGESAELADALRALGQFHWRHGNSAEADAYLRRAIDVAGRVDAPASRRRDAGPGHRAGANGSHRRGDADDRGCLLGRQAGRRPGEPAACVQQLRITACPLRLGSPPRARDRPRGSPACGEGARGGLDGVAAQHGGRDLVQSRRAGRSGARCPPCDPARNGGWGPAAHRTVVGEPQLGPSLAWPARRGSRGAVPGARDPA
jgi:predicted ATPase